MRRVAALTIVLLFAGAARGEPPFTSRPLVWVVDGAGDYHGLSKSVTQANTQAGNPFEPAIFYWSHTHHSLLLDQTDWKYARLQGARLAERIRQRSQEEPCRRVVILAHSAGAAVTLSACDYLPPGSIDRIILLAPSVSSRFDVRGGLAASNEGIDVFCSKKDWIALGVATRLVGTVDKRWAPAAGRLGFRLKPAEPDRLRHYFWTNEMAWTGYTGGHSAVHAPTFLAAYVFPMMSAN